MFRAIVIGLVALGLILGWDASRQPTAGHDWQLLGRQRSIGQPNSIAVVTDQVQLAAAWKALHLSDDPSRVDFDRSIVFWLTSIGTIGCPSRLDDLRIDPGAALVDATFSRGFTLGCDDGIVPDSFLVRVERERLPTAPYRVRLSNAIPGTTGAELQVEP